MELISKKPSKHEGCSIVLYKRADKVCPFVTWNERAEDGSRCWGHYFGTLEAAQIDFNERN